MTKENEEKEKEADAKIKQLKDEVAEGAKNLEKSTSKLKESTSVKGRIFGVSTKKGGSTNRRYSFKKLQKRKRANKSNKTQAKRGKRLNRSKKMRR